MSLNWDVEDVAVIPNDRAEHEVWNDLVSYEQPKVEHPLTNWQLLDALIWRTLLLGWGWKLTEDKVELAIKRNLIIERIIPDLSTIPPKFIADMVGFSTNVGKITDAEFAKQNRKRLDDYATRSYRTHFPQTQVPQQLEVKA